ncbi:hypothetical protein PCASD_13814 [Puccinia coronata f. sp. avenae]|uniref:Phospholipid-transporting ATPase n=1 Tax=Puccinia coronata f. sp. avenae TaxID=200324 RepID=A0A2N5U5T9_9BASI|nr:hypothetical protein PCASD_13814 [Puccinia coronata f. sp. avenae]
MSPIPLWKQFPRSTSAVNHSSWRDKLTGFDISTYFDPPKTKPIPRHVFINLPLPSGAWKSSKNGQLLVGKPIEAWEHPNNQIQTAKYSLLTFIPRNLAEQFRRIANAFFLLIVILQFLPQFSQISPIIGALPLLVVLTITAVKDAYEDVRRHAADHKTNHQLVDTISPNIYTNPNFTKPYPRGFKFISNFHHFREKLELNPNPAHKRHWWSRRHTVPHSVVAPNSKSDNSEDEKDNSKGFVPTTWQDLRVGDFIRLKNDDPVPADVIICATSDPEENVCFIETKNLDGETNLKSRHALPALSHLRSDSDCANAQNLQNRFIVENQAPDADLFSYSAAVLFPELGHRVPVSLESVLLRGTVLRNTEWVIALIVLAGPDTKVMLNSKGTPSKRSKVERQMNPMVFINLGILGFMCIFNGIGTRIAESYYYARNSYWTTGSNLPDDNPRINGLVSFANALVTYQNIVPISLYISIEFVRTVQAYFIWADDDLEFNGRRTLARSWNLSDDLGQIQYIFSDKTGTLTQNLMQFRKCTVGGTVYQGSNEMGAIGEQDGRSRGSDQEAEYVDVLLSNIQGETISSGKQNPQLEPFTDIKLLEDLLEVETEQSLLLRKFFTCLGLCHTVLANEDVNGSIQYKAQSPDEAALVQAAADVGFVFRGRDKNLVRLQLPPGLRASQLPEIAVDEQVQSLLHQPTILPENCKSWGIVEEYELLEVNQFTSMRKRMSVVVQKLEDQRPIPGELYLFVKGADNVIFERLAPGQEAIREQVDGQLESFAAEGLRTLCLAYRKLDRSQLEAWSFKYNQALSQLGEGREDLIESVQDELEHDLVFLGATAIEDKLQDGVPEAISDLKRAGIKVWVATGDKLETAVAIAKSCQLIGNDMNLIVVRGGAYGKKKSAYEQIRKSLINFFDGGELVDTLKELPPGPERRTSSQSYRRLSMANSMGDDLTSLVGEDNGKRAGGYGLVIDGPSLNYALSEKFTKEALLELSTRCEAVVCCRASPKHKAEIVKLIKEGIQVTTLAIGDGANDVSMIQTADIGIGVLGEEGMQAVNSSDYSICQFKFITKLLLVHGHWSYDRNAKMIIYFFYQQIIGIIPLFLYQFWCAYSTTTLFEYTYVLLYNAAWTLLPAIGMGIFNQDIREKVLMQVPELYSIGREGKSFGVKRFIIYMVEGTYQGAIVYLVLAYTYNTNSTRRDGWDIPMDEFSTVVIVATILACNLFIGLGQLCWNWWAFGCVCFGPVAIIVYTLLYSAIRPELIYTTVYGNNKFLWTAPSCWFGLILSIALCVLPRCLLNYYQNTYHPTDIQILREVDRKDREFDFRLDDRMHFSREKNSYNDKQLQSQLEIENHEKRIKASVKEYDPSGSNYVDGYVNIGGEELIRSRTSFTLDMATGQSSTVERGFNFDQADGVGERVVGARLRRLNSSLLSISSPIEVRESNHMDQLFSRSNSEGADLNRVHEHLLKETSKQYNFANFSFASGERGSTHSLVPSKDHHKQLSSHEETSDHANRQETHDRSNQSSQHHLFREEYRIQTSHLTEARPTTDPRYRSIASEQAITESPQSYCDPWQQGKRRKAHEKSGEESLNPTRPPLSNENNTQLPNDLCKSTPELEMIQEEGNRHENHLGDQPTRATKTPSLCDEQSVIERDAGSMNGEGNQPKAKHPGS